MIVADSGYGVTKLVLVLGELSVELVGRIRSDWVVRQHKPVRLK